MMVLQFAFPLALWLGIPCLLAVLALSLWRRSDRYTPKLRRAVLTSLRGGAMLLAIFLIARPMLVESQEELPPRKRVVVLLDRSESMGLEEHGQTRFQQALTFARKQLMPALQTAGLQGTAVLFAEEGMVADGPSLANAQPTGLRTNLGRAILRGLTTSETPPLAVVALTDGAANDDSENRRAMAALIESRVPFIGIGMGSETGPRTLDVQQVTAPPVAPRQQQFSISANLESGGTGDLPGLELLLMRNGQLLQRREIAAGTAGRVWQESFEVTESEEGIYQYTVQTILPPDSPVRIVNDSREVNVRITGEKELRVLYVQGALTWDYKFIRLALASDPAIKLTGLSRTSTASVFYQNVEDAAELKQGFPTRLEDLAVYAVVVLSTIRPQDLTPHQQEILGRYCGEFGGGVLMIGGPETFDHTWRESRLEQLLAVRFNPLPQAAAEQPFQLTLTPEALENPVFQISDNMDPRSAWARVPPFTNFAVVDQIKPGAEVWGTHSHQHGPQGPRVLMACQRFGSGRSAVLGIQNFWRWRLAKDSDPHQYDRFWQQLLRYLSEGSREQVAVRLPDQSLMPPTDVRLLIERQPDPRRPDDSPRPFTLQVTNAAQKLVTRQQIELGPARPVEVSFRGVEAGSYSVVVMDAQDVPIANRSIELHSTNLELQRAPRDMERLRQWATISQGSALPAENCGDVAKLLADLIQQATVVRRQSPRHEPIGINGWILTLLASCLSGEWLLRKRWGLQ